MDQTFSSEELARLRAFLQVMTAVPPTAPPTTSQLAAPSIAPVSLLSQPLSQSLSSLPTQQPPIATLYQSGHQQPQSSAATVASGSAAMARFQPFSGIGLNLPTGLANQARMASASSSIPRSVALPRRTSRWTRGPAQNLPVPIQARKPSIDDCVVAGAATPTIRIKIFVYLPIVSLFWVKIFSIKYWFDI